MSIATLAKLVDELVRANRKIGESCDKVEERLADLGVSAELSEVLKIHRAVKRYEKTRLENLMKLRKLSKARELLGLVEENPMVTHYLVEGKVGNQWKLILRTEDLNTADSVQDEYTNKYPAVRIMEETPHGSRPIKGHREG